VTLLKYWTPSAEILLPLRQRFCLSGVFIRAQLINFKAQVNHQNYLQCACRFNKLTYLSIFLALSKKKMLCKTLGKRKQQTPAEDKEENK